MIPAFNADGNLPEGVHVANLDEFLGRFGVGSARRKWLGERFRELLALVKATGKLERVFVWGSFVSAKELPNDMDLLLLMNAEFRLADVPEDSRMVFDSVRAKMRFQADVFWAESSIGEETLLLWLDTYQTTRAFTRRGIIELRKT